MKIIKRDGRKVNFDAKKIEKAIAKAFVEVDGENASNVISECIAHDIADYVEKLDRTLSVEKIQDIVEEKLMESSRKDVAKAYIVYRNNRTKIREANSDFIKKVTEKLNASNVQNSNANIDEYSFGGKVGEASDVLLKKLALDDAISNMARKNHENNMIYIHDLNSYVVGMHNCLSLPIDSLLANGFKVRKTDIRPAKSINTACQLIAVLFQVQSLMQFGGVSATHVDWSLAPYVKISFMKHYISAYVKMNETFQSLNLLNMSSKELDDWVDKNKEFYLSEMNLTAEDFYFDNKDNLDPVLYQIALFDTIKETYQAIEGMFHNLNTLLSRSGNQLPFSSINYGTCTSPEGRLIIKAILETSIKGVGKMHRTSIFPCQIFQCMKGVNREPGDANYDLYKLALKSTAQRLYPNYANVDWSGNAGYDKNDPKTFFSTMGCRTANGFDINGFGQLKDGRGNICPVTIIMPTLAMMAKENVFKDNTTAYQSTVIDEFLLLLDKKIHEAKDMLIERFEWICKQNPKSASFMYENNTMAGYVPEEGIRSALKHGTLAIGQVGLAETLQLLIGCNQTTDEGMKLAKKIESLFRTRADEFKKEYMLNFGVYYTPAEGLCYTAMKNFQAKYGIIENVSDKDFFTNSIHVPVWENVDAITKIDIESQLTGYSNAGCITYIELDAGVKYNLEAMETLVNYAMDKDIPYFAINVPNDTCLDCGYIDEFNDSCPMCKSKNIQRLRRVTGLSINR